MCSCHCKPPRRAKTASIAQSSVVCAPQRDRAQHSKKWVFRSILGKQREGAPSDSKSSHSRTGQLAEVLEMYGRASTVSIVKESGVAYLRIGCMRTLTRPTIVERSRKLFPNSKRLPRNNPMKLRPNESCPIHRSLSCCGREPVPKTRVLRLGVQRVEDPHHPRGYRELRSRAEMRKLLNSKIVEQNGICPICLEEFTTTTMSCRITKTPREWEELGETTIRTTSKQHTGGATKKRDQPEWMTDGRSASHFR
jgi:hypothetical protein